MTDFSPEAMRRRFAELTTKRDEILQQSTPLREQRDRMLADHQQQQKNLNDEIAKVETGLFDIDQERAMLARALNGKTGDPANEDRAETDT